MTPEVHSKARKRAQYHSLLSEAGSPLHLALLPSVLLHVALIAAMTFSWGATERRAMIERDVYMVSAVVLPRAEGLPDLASAPPPPPPGQQGELPPEPPRPNEMLLKTEQADASQGEPQPVSPEPPPKPQVRPSRAELLASLAPEDDELRFATDPDGDQQAKPDDSLRQQYGRQLTAYERRVRDAIQYNWFPKFAGSKRSEAWAAIGFSIDKNGNIRDPKIDRSSGDFVYDQSCLRAVTRTRRVPAPPAGANRAISVGFSPQDKP